MSNQRLTQAAVVQRVSAVSGKRRRAKRNGERTDGSGIKVRAGEGPRCPRNRHTAGAYAVYSAQCMLRSSGSAAQVRASRETQRQHVPWWITNAFHILGALLLTTVVWHTQHAMVFYNRSVEYRHATTRTLALPEPGSIV